MRFINKIKRSTILLVLLLIGQAMGCWLSAQIIVEESVSVCAGDYYEWNGVIYTTSGDYTQTFQTVNGCDSVVTLHLTINKSESNVYTETACDSYTWNGQTYTVSGTYTYNTTAAGCPRVDTLHLTINNSVTTEFTEVACESYYWNGSIYTTSGNYSYTTTSSTGCDSTTILHLTFEQPTVEDIYITSEESYSWNGSIYTTSGNYSYTTTSSTGCDSTVILHLTILPPSPPEVLLNINLPNKNGINQVYFSSESDYGYFYENSSIPVFEGEEVYIRYYLNSGYKSKTVTLNGVIQNNSGNYLEFVMPSSDVELVIDVEFDPSSPSDPQPADTTKYYNLSLVCNPSTAASVSGKGNYVAGKSIYVSTSANSGYLFTGWSEKGEIISTKQGFYYTMPASDAVLTANYVYNPASPTDPEQPKLKHPLSVIASPVGAGTFSTTGSTVTYGEEYYVYAYPNSGYKFKGWIVNGVAQANESTTLTGVMTEAGASVVGLFVFDPSSPSNPGANYYNPTTGQAIIDDFTPGSLYSAMRNLIGSDNYENVSSLIVKGRLESNDYGYLSYLSNATTIDLSRTGGVTTIPSYAFQNLVAANILLSSEITSIRNYAFSGCTNLTSLTLYALVPPTCSSNAFKNFTNKANCTVYVPASAIELYSTSDYWKDFTLLPITDDAHILQVNLPEEASDGRYKHNSLEIVNITSGVRQKYVISDRLLYTFNGLRKDEQYNIYLYSQAGLEIGKIENVVIPDQDIEVTFDKLKTLYTISAKVLDIDGNDVTSHVSIEWLKPLADGSISYIRKANSLGQIPEGQKLICRVSLDNTLGVLYHNPKDVEFTVNENENTCSITLLPFRSIALTGTIVDGDGVALSGASVSVSQVLNGKYNKTFTAKTDRNGAWSVSICEAPETRLTYTATECINVNDTIGEFDENITTFDLGKVTLKSIVGARISYGFTYHAAGVDEVETYYSDYQNVAISVFNVTQNRYHKEVSLQYPTLVILDENVNVGDKLQLTATSKTGAFNSIEQIVTIGDNQRAEVTFDIVGKGGIQASFEMTENPVVIAMLYSSKGEFLKKLTYSETIVKFTELEDGDYTLITMGQSNLMNSILRLSNFAEIGLSEGRDYLKNNIKVESGKLAEIKNTEVPAFDESLFYYTNSSTSFSSNKSSITTGNYLTLRSTIDFKGVYKNDVSNVALVVDLPEACDFVEQSVIQGPNLLPYTLDNNRLTIQLGNDYKSLVRFCVVPTIGGNFNATASVVFDYNGKTITQPIGSAMSEIKDLDISVPTIINSEIFNVNGMAPAGSQIEVYEDDVLIGSVRALANGTWMAECIIPKTYNFTTHTIYAIITTKAGLMLKSKSVSVEINRNSSSPKTVLMTFYNAWLNQNVNVTFDFVNLTIDNPAYMFYKKTKLTFVADFTDNNPQHMSNVTLWILSSNNTETAVTMAYDEVSGKWVGCHDFDYYSAPINIALEYSFAGQSFFDRKQFSDFDEERESVLVDNLAERAEFIAAFNSKIHNDSLASRLSELFAQDEPNEEEIRRLLKLTGESGSTDISIMSDEEFDDLSKQAEKSREDWESNGAVTMLQTALSDYFADPEYNLLSDYEFTSELEDGIKTVSKKKLPSVNPEDLKSKGYDVITLDDSTEIYILYSENLMEIIDCGHLIKYSIVIEPSTLLEMKARAKVPVMPGSYLYYAAAAENAIQAIYNLSNTDKRRWLVDVAQKIDEATQSISDFYESFMTDFNENIEAIYSGLSVLCDKAIEDQEALAEAAEERIKKYTNQIEANKQQRDVLRNNREFVKNSTTIPENQKQHLLAEYDEEIQKLTDENKYLNGKRVGSNKQLNLAKSELAKLKEQSSRFRKVHTQIRETLDKFPKRLAKGLRIPKYLRVCGKVAGELGLPLQCWSLFDDMMDMSDDIKDWIPLMDRIDSHFCYKKEDPDAVILRETIYDRANWHAWHNVGILSSEIGAIGFSLAGGVPGSPTWWGEMGFSVIAENWKFFNDRASFNERTQFRVQVSSLKCDNPDDDNNTNPTNNNNNHNYPFNPAHPIHDPSGYVYEAVPENRVGGVRATIYYKETKEDMYGDLYEEVVLWDAEEYAQKNPLFTDENGMYRWDVPQGLWQVKFEKDGYQTAYSEWLPVPPPQLEVNIGIVQNKQPEVIEARAYEEGVEVQFDKFMDLTTLTTNNIYVTANGEKLNGEIRFIDSVLADEYANEDDSTATRYASRVRFIPEISLSVTTGEIRLTVSRNVLSYAGIPMTETFSQVLDVEKEVQSISASDVKILYGEEKEVTVYAIPFEAAVGRTLHIANSSALIASVDTTEVVLDNEGKAVVKVTGDLPGCSQLTFTIDDVVAKGTCVVDVVTELKTAEEPKSSRASGTAVYRGTKVELSTDLKDADIYFTTDGSCPCDEEGTRRKYTVPIIINEDTKILAMTSVGDGDDDISETVEFNYTLKRSDMDFQMQEGWTWISHNFESAISPSELAFDEGVLRILSQSQEVIRDPQLGMVGTLTSLSAYESYKVETTRETARQRLSDVAWNPTTPINLVAGWNWLGYPISQTMSVDEAFAATEAETLDVVVGQNGFAQFDGEKWVGTLEIMSPGKGYMYRSQSTKDVNYNTSIVSTAAAKHAVGIAPNLPLVLDVHKYGQIMPIVATINNAEGTNLDNEYYQVVAFCGSECRGIGRVVNGLVMMNVYGNINDNITFEVSDVAGEKKYSSTISLNFSENIVGDIFNPYKIIINSATSITDVKYSGNIKVSVKGDMLKIKGINADEIDFVEVYNLNGLRLLRETEVSVSGIRISNLNDGVYVVIVNGKGEYTYHKIIIH